MKTLALGAAICVLLSAVAATALANGGPDGARGQRLDHVFVIMLENHSKSSVIDDANAPYITSLAHQYAVAENYYGVTHPSQPNYVAAISGSAQRVISSRQ